MEKGSSGRLIGAPAAAFLILGLAAASSRPGQVSPPAWWEVRLSVAVKGDYSIRGGEAPVSGEYACRALWEGRLEPEGDDFLLVHLKTEIPEWRLREMVLPPAKETILEASRTPGPVLRLNYVLREGRDVEFDFFLEGITVPLHDFPLEVALDMPRSGGTADRASGSRYGDFILRGSNRIVLQETDLARRTLDRTFSWEWRQVRRPAQSPGDFVVIQHHRVEAVVALVAH